MESQSEGPPDRQSGQIDVFDTLRVRRLRQHIISDSRFGEFSPGINGGKQFYEVEEIHCELEPGSLLVGLVYDLYVQGIRMYFYNERWAEGLVSPPLPDTESTSPLVWHPDLKLKYLEAYHPERLTWRDRKPMI